MEVQIIPAKIEFTLEQLNYALREVYELWNYWEYMLMGDTAKGAKEGKLYGDKIEIGIKKKYLTRDVMSALKTHLQYAVDRGYSEYMKIGEEKIRYSVKQNKADLLGIPVECRVIHRNYQFFKYPDTVVYKYDEFKTPNPLEKYYKAR